MVAFQKLEVVKMPIKGVGTDIVETERIESACMRNDGFATRIFTQKELDYSVNKPSQYLHLAARFAAKEAVAKALGQSFEWHDVEVTNELSGKPTITLYGKAKEVAAGATIHVSISHTENYASAIAIVEVSSMAALL